MRGINHIGLAACVLSAYSFHAGWPGLLSVSSAVIGSLAPDLDGGGTIARPSNFLPHLFPKWLMDFVDWFGIHFSKLVKKIFGHRGILHWPIIGLLISYAGFYTHVNLLMFFGFGWLLHLAGDIITVNGIPLFGPFSHKKISVFGMRVGSQFEGFVGVCFWITAIGLTIVQIVQIEGLVGF